MELTHPINNQHMVDGLNKVLIMTFRLQRNCELMLQRTADPSAFPLIERLIKVHQSHISLLHDAIRYLGGHLAERSNVASASWWRANFFALRLLRRRERQLIELCKQQIKFLAGSDEVTEKLNTVRDDIAACLHAPIDTKA